MPQARMPRISVLTCCYKYLQRLRVFLRALAHQTLDRRDYEVVITNPQSPDGLAEYIEALRLAQPDLNLALADAPEQLKGNRGWMITRAFERSSGRAVMVADCDCIMPPHFLGKAVAVLEKHPDRVLGARRNFLSPETTARILCGFVDPIAHFERLRGEDCQEELGYRGVLGYCQIVTREVFERTKYRDDIESIARSDVTFVEDLWAQQRVAPLQLEDETLLHLWHPRDWAGTKTFL